MDVNDDGMIRFHFIKTYCISGTFVYLFHLAGGMCGGKDTDSANLKMRKSMLSASVRSKCGIRDVGMHLDRCSRLKQLFASAVIAVQNITATWSDCQSTAKQ